MSWGGMGVAEAPTHLLKQRHGELLVRDAVLGGADVLLGLGRDVKVDPHQDVLLWEAGDH